MSNTFVDVATFQTSGLAILLNEYGVIANLNSKYKEFNNLTSNLGSTVQFSLPIRTSTSNTLVFGPTANPIQQRFETLTAVNQIMNEYAITAQELVLNAVQYLDMFGRSAVCEVGAEIEKTIAQDILNTTYRFYGTPSDPINTYAKLAESIAMFRDYGAARTDTKALIPNLSVSSIVASGVSQFVPVRNDEIAAPWMIGEFQNTEFIRSNLLPLHRSGTVGNDGLTLTLTSIDPTGTLLTFSGAGAAGTINENDKLYFVDNVVGKPNLRYLTFTGYSPCGNPVQVRVTSTVTADGTGNITVPVYPALIYDNTPVNPNPNRNLNFPISGGGFEAKVLADFRVGVIWSGNAWYLAMPPLPSMAPFYSHSQPDPDSGISLRNYHAPLVGANKYVYVNDAIYGSKLVGEYAMAMIFPA